ncbi:MAG: hypothetical protein PHY91_10185 [Tissierellia bacterium]|nr:hypothetical protein [Tissierellia bacterium]
MRCAMKDPKKVKKLVERINVEIELNKQEFMERDKELKDLLKIIESTQKIIGAQEEK